MSENLADYGSHLFLGATPPRSSARWFGVDTYVATPLMIPLAVGMHQKRSKGPTKVTLSQGTDPVQAFLPEYSRTGLSLMSSGMLASVQFP